MILDDNSQQRGAQPNGTRNNVAFTACGPNS